MILVGPFQLRILCPHSKSWRSHQLLEGSGWTCDPSGLPHTVCCPPASSSPISLDSSGNHTVESKSSRAGRRKSSTKPRTPQGPSGTIISGDVPTWCYSGGEMTILLYTSGYVGICSWRYHPTPLFRIQV